MKYRCSRQDASLRAMLFLLLSLTPTCSLSWSSHITVFMILSTTSQIYMALHDTTAAGVDIPQRL